MAEDTPSKGQSRNPSHSRRAFLKGLGAASLSVPIASIASAAIQRRPDVLSGPGTLNFKTRRDQSFNNRFNAAVDDHQVTPAPQVTNGDEARYRSGIANFTKGFPHNSFGEIDPSVYAAYLAAVKTGKRADFDALTMGGTERLVDPQSGIAFDLETLDQSQSSIPPFDTLASPGLAAQMIEVYWQALVRDVAFTDYETDSSIAIRGLRVERPVVVQRPSNRRQCHGAELVSRLHVRRSDRAIRVAVLSAAVHDRRDAVCRLPDCTARRFRDRPRSHG